ncbi:MAG: sugar phosphate isomerase/epimerase [Phycisphaerae bacterium]
MGEARRRRIGLRLCLWGITYTAGLQGRGTPRANPDPITPSGLLELADRLALAGVELSPAFIGRTGDSDALEAFRRQAEGLGLAITLAGPRLDTPHLPEAMREAFEVAGLLGCRTVRTTLSGILCGDRSAIGGLDGWRRHLEAVADALKRIAPMAEQRSIRVGIENHQDATSQDLLWLCERVGSASVGVTFDTGNPLAVGEDVLAFARRVLPHVVNVHLKDYRMFAAPAGYRLVRCALGRGVVPFGEVLDLLAGAPDAAMSIELASLHDRYIRILEDDYWSGLGGRDVAAVLPVLRLWRHREETGEFRTPWQRGQDDRLAAYEMEELTESVRFLRTLVS